MLVVYHKSTSPVDYHLSRDKSGGCDGTLLYFSQQIWQFVSIWSVFKVLACLCNPCEVLVSDVDMTDLLIYVPYLPLFTVWLSGRVARLGQIFRPI